jgi:redox-sensing transcriptional repressor
VQRTAGGVSRIRVAIPERSVERLIAYRRRLRRRLAEGKARIYSHELAALGGVTPVLVRRDLMLIGFSNSPARGYDAAALIEKIDSVLDTHGGHGIVLVGVGALGRAVLKFLATTHPELSVVGAFDVAPEKVGTEIGGCHCYALSDLESVVAKCPVVAAVLAVPAAAAQQATDRLVAVGVRGVLNFTPVRLRVPPEVYVEDVDIAVSLEKVVYFARGARQASD